MKPTTNKTPQNGKQKQATTKSTKSKSDIAEGLRDLLQAELKDIYWAEKALTKAIPKMIKNATSEQLIDALTSHLEVTTEHVTRLEDVFASIGAKPEAKKCEAMAGLIKEAEEIMADTAKGAVRDAGIILAGQKVEHYEIATYGTLASFAKTLGEDEAASLLEETLNEEKEANETLSGIAQTINVEATGEDDDNGIDNNDEDTAVAVKLKENKINN